MSAFLLSVDLIDEVILWIDTWNEPRTEQTQSKYWKVEKVPNKGFGMIAIRDIPAHTIFIVEKPILFATKYHLLSENDKNKSPAQLLLDDFNKLPSNEQNIVMNLSNVFNVDEKENNLEGIYGTNGVQTIASKQHKSAMFPTFARINHDCIPNCTMYFKSYPAQSIIGKTLFDIKQNEEITISYLPRFQNTYKERQHLLSLRYRFQCVCNLCLNKDSFDSIIKEYRLSIMNGDKHWNCIQIALQILNKYFKSFPSVKVGLLSAAIECAIDNYLYDNAIDLMIESIQLCMKCFGLHCKRWKELYQQIITLKSYWNHPKCDQLLIKYQCLWDRVEKE